MSLYLFQEKSFSHREKHCSTARELFVFLNHSPLGGHSLEDSAEGLDRYFCGVIKYKCTKKALSRTYLIVYIAEDGSVLLKQRSTASFNPDLLQLLYSDIVKS